MRKLLKVLLAVILLVTAGLFTLYFIYDEPLPKGENPEEADTLAHLMLDALNHEAYDNLKVIQWTYQNTNEYIWNRQEDSVTVKWADMKVKFCTKTLQGRAKEGEKLLSGEALLSAVSTAWSLFANDSFWLVAPFKVNDPGTNRAIVEYEGKKCLLVNYTSGGVTPGDSYLWILDSQYRPVAWKFWVKIIPIGGLKFTWEGWKEVGGVWFATNHVGPKSIPITNLSAY